MLALPALSVSSRNQLQALAPETIVPRWASQRSQVSSRLLKIEFVGVRSVVDSKGDRSYVVEVYGHSSKNRIPTNRSHAPASPANHSTSMLSVSETSSKDTPRKSIACTRRQYSDVVELRREVYTLAHQAHKGTPCEFCKAMIREIILGDALPGSLLKLIAGEAKVEKMLARAVNSVLALVTRAGDGEQCSGQNGVLQTLHDFLFKDGSTTTR